MVRSTKTPRSSVGGLSFNKFYRTTKSERDCTTNDKACKDYESARCDYTCKYAQQKKNEELAAREGLQGKVNF